MYNVSPAGATDIFILKLDSAGNFLWVNNLVGGINDFENSISLDDAGNISTLGFFATLLISTLERKFTT